MADLINGLGGPTDFGEIRGPRFDDQIVRDIDITPIFASGLGLFGRSYDTISISANGFVLLENGFGGRLGSDRVRADDPAGFYLYWADHLPRDGDAAGPDARFVTEGGNSTGSGAIWYDLDPDTGTLTVTYDDVREFGGRANTPNAYQLRFTDISDRPGASEGAFTVDYRYENIEWGDRFEGATGFSFGDDLNAFNIPGTDTAAGKRALTEAGVISFTFDGETVTSNLPGLPEIPLIGPPIRGTDGNDRIVGTDDGDAIRPGRGRDTIEPGLGADRIDLGQGANTVAGTIVELLDDTLEGGFERDKLLFEDVAFGREIVSVSEREDVLLFDADGDGTEDGRITIEDQFIGGSSVLTATARAGTYMALVDNLPKLATRNFGEDRWAGDQITDAYLRGDGRADFVLRLDEASTTLKDGLAMGVYTYDREGAISNARLLTTDVREEGEAEFLLDDIGRGENIGVFVMNPDRSSALDDVDSFVFVDETGGEAGFDDRSFVFAEVNGEVIGGDLMHSARSSLNADLQQRALIGMTDRPGLTVVMEDGLFSGRDFNDVVLSIERLPVDLAIDLA